jgi:hypothetical protein
MTKGKVARLAGFIGALGVSTVLVTTAVQGTGAYFQDSFDGTMSASSGHLTLTKTSGSTTLDYANLMPGDNIDKTFNYQVSVSSGTVDVWMVFDTNAQAYQAFTGGKGSPLWTDGGLGRYGYFKVADSNGGTAFRSGNLSFPPYADSQNQVNSTSTSGDQCATTDGRGGDSWIATAGDTHPSGYCGVPGAIRLASGLSDTATGSVTVTFGLNGVLQTQQNQVEFNNNHVVFQIVATQHGIAPSA